MTPSPAGEPPSSGGAPQRGPRDDLVASWRERVRFDPARPPKADLWRGARLFAGLDCLLPGQSRAPHVHEGADKLYLVLEGEGAFEVAGRRFTAGAGALVPAAAGEPHGVANPGSGPLVVLTVMAPPPGAV